ncbi:MAG: DUF5107 domain-containing protein [Deltaproteobacteria bacterium]|nr:MAG: DUF5107 domain-containing protein [Deltaproteobacteria bacterium]
MKNKIFVPLLLTFIFLTVMAHSQKDATIRETIKVLKTYPFSDPNRIPKPDSYYYPYFRFDGFAKEGTDKEWKVVILENDFIKVSIFPEVGGKIWGAIEKSTGHEFIYYNSVVKFRDIAMRGAWTSGGIELNFGVIGHAPTSATPVDYVIKTKEDGSVSCYISATDNFTRTRWETEVNLQKNKAYFTTTTTWHNPTPLVQPYYQWMNAAYQVDGDLEFCFPGANWIGHDGNAHTWPVDKEGRDLSWYKNNNFGDSKSNHVLGGISEHYAAYWHDLEFGLGHYSLYGEKLGMKVFQWAHSRSGGIWEDLLTDTDGQYVELQSGRLFNQPGSSSTKTPFKHFGFEAYATDVFEEYWFPILNTKGVKKANSFGVINIEKSHDGQMIYFCPLQKTVDEISIYRGGKLIEKIKIDLDVLETWTKNIGTNPSDEPMKIVLGDNKLVYAESPKENELNRPMEAPMDFDWNTTYGLFLDGQQWIYQNKYDRALVSFKKCLENDPNYSPAINQLAMLYYRKADFNNALEHARKSLSINTYDAEANFIYGLINKKLEKLLDAQDGFSLTSLKPSYRNAAYIELAKLSMIKGDFLVARQYSMKVIHSNSTDLEANKLMAVICRKGNNAEMATGFQNKMESIAVLNHFSNFEKMLLKGGENLKDEFIGLIRNEMPHETLLEMAQWYEDAGCVEEAIILLKLSESQAMVYFKLAYLNNEINDNNSSDTYLEKAVQSSPDFVLPFRMENVAVLKWATGQTDNWRPKYYLALLNWSLGNIEKAKESIVKCGDLPDYPYFYLAKAALFKGDTGYDGEGDLIKARELGKEDWRTSEKLIEYYLANSHVERALEIAKESIVKFPSNDVLRYVYAKCLMADGQYSACKKTLANTTILPSEGARYGRTTYRQACMMESVELYEKGKYSSAIKSAEQARLWPENLGAGQPYDVDERIEDFFKAECLSRKGKTKQAEELYQSIISFTEQQKLKYSSTSYLYLVALTKVNKKDQIQEYLNQWEQSKPNDPLQRWSKSMIEKDFDNAQKIESQINTMTGGTPWDPKYADPEFEIVKAIGKMIST